MRAIAEIAALANERAENIGARRLHTVMERLLDEVSFDAPDKGGAKLCIDAELRARAARGARAGRGPRRGTSCGRRSVSRPTPRILVVDDERFFREVIREALAGAGLDVDLAASGPAGARAPRRAPGFGVVVLDLQLPDLHGLEVLRRAARAPARAARDHPLRAHRAGSTCSRRSASAPATTSRSRCTKRSWCSPCGARSPRYDLARRLARPARAARAARGSARRAGRPGGGHAPAVAAGPARAGGALGRRRARRREDLAAAARRRPGRAARGRGARPRDPARRARPDATSAGAWPASRSRARSRSWSPTSGADGRFPDRCARARLRLELLRGGAAPLRLPARSACSAPPTAQDGPMDDDDLALLRILARQVARLLDQPEVDADVAETETLVEEPEALAELRRRPRSRCCRAETRAAPRWCARSARRSPPRWSRRASCRRRSGRSAVALARGARLAVPRGGATR